MTNILVTAMLLTGGSAVASSLCGVPTAAACFLLPIGVVLYTMAGGIKATFLTDYLHTVIILVIIFVFAFSAYATNAVVGSPGKVWELLVDAAKRHPVSGNHEGSYLTMRSQQGAVFFVINIVGNFGTVFLDNGKLVSLLPQAELVADPCTRLLQQSHRRLPSRRTPGLCDGWAFLVRHPLAVCNNDGPRSSRPRK